MDVLIDFINFIFGRWREPQMPRQLFILTCITEALKEGYTDPEQIVSVAAEYGRTRNLSEQEIAVCMNWELMDFTSAG